MGRKLEIVQDAKSCSKPKKDARNMSCQTTCGKPYVMMFSNLGGVDQTPLG